MAVFTVIVSEKLNGKKQENNVIINQFKLPLQATWLYNAVRVVIEM